MKKYASLLVLCAVLCVSIRCYAADPGPALTETFGNEGGKTVDDGGPTNWGISQRSYPNMTKQQIFDLTLDQAAVIYRRDYWQPLGLDAMPSQIIANEIFDGAVNEGVGTAARRIQTAINLSNGNKSDIKVDGVLGSGTWAAFAQCDLIEFYVNWIILRGTRYQSLVVKDPAKFQQYFKSWTYRLKNNVAKAVHEYEVAASKR